MSKFIQQIIKVQAKQGIPERLYFHDWQQVESIIDHWREIGQWWLGEQKLDVFRINTPQGVYELHYLPETNQWMLYRIED